ncbi:MAG: hypothetical protein ACTHJ0_14045 [Flavipsychrobacter sp.]
MRKIVLALSVIMVLIFTLSSCAIHRHRIESGDRGKPYFHHHSHSWYR